MLAIVACCAVLAGAELELYEEVDVDRDTAAAASPLVVGQVQVRKDLAAASRSAHFFKLKELAAFHDAMREYARTEYGVGELRIDTGPWREAQGLYIADVKGFAP